MRKKLREYALKSVWRSDELQATFMILNDIRTERQKERFQEVLLELIL